MSSSVKVESLLGMLTIKLNDKNFAKWVFQFTSVLKGYKLFGHFDGSISCPPKYVVSTDRGVTNTVSDAFLEWESVDLALLSLLIATLSDESIEYVLGSRTAHEAWINLQDRYASVSKARVNTLKTEFQTMQKGASSVDQYLSRLRNIKDQLVAAGEVVSDNDFIVAALSGLPREYSVIRTVIFTRDTTMTLREFREQLLCAEREADSVIQNLSPNIAGLYMQGSSGSGTYSSMAQGSSSNSTNVPLIPGCTLTPIPGAHSVFGGHYSSGASSSNAAQMPYLFPQSQEHYNSGVLSSNVAQIPYPFSQSQEHYSSGTSSSNVAQMPYPVSQSQAPIHLPFSQSSAPVMFPSSYPFSQHQDLGYHENASAYGFVGTANIPRQFHPNGSRPQYGSKPNGNGVYRSQNYGNNRGGQSGQFGGRSNGGSGQSWSGNTEVKPNIVPECQICFKRGHTAPNCWKRSTQSSSGGQGMECQICGKKGHSALDCYHRNNFAYQGTPPAPTLTAMQAHAPPTVLPNDSWIIDTGASHHMTANIDSLQQVTSYPGNDKITIGNGEGQGNQSCSLPRKE